MVGSAEDTVAGRRSTRRSDRDGCSDGVGITESVTKRQGVAELRRTLTKIEFRARVRNYESVSCP